MAPCTLKHKTCRARRRRRNGSPGEVRQIHMVQCSAMAKILRRAGTAPRTQHCALAAAQRFQRHYNHRSATLSLAMQPGLQHRREPQHPADKGVLFPEPEHGSFSPAQKSLCCVPLCEQIHFSSRRVKKCVFQVKGSTQNHNRLIFVF